MISVHTTDAGPVHIGFTTGMTVDQLVQKLRDDHQLEIRGGYSLQETKTGRVLDPAEPVDDHRVYHLNAWLVRHGKFGVDIPRAGL